MSENGEIFCAFIADIVKSREMDEQQRFEVQKKIDANIEKYNADHGAALAVKIDFSGGDQLQALFQNAFEAYKFACNFRERLFPIEFRIGLGVGNWSLRFPGESTNKQDGTAYQNARAAYDYAHKINKKIAFLSGSKADADINLDMTLEHAIFDSQSKTQKQVFNKYKEMYPICAYIKSEYGIMSVCVDKGSQAAIADELRSSRQNINKIVRKGLIQEQRDLQGAILLFLSTLYGVRGENN